MNAKKGRSPPTETHIGAGAPQRQNAQPLGITSNTFFNNINTEVMKTTVIGSNKGKDNSSVENSKAEKEKVNGLPTSAEFEDKAKTEPSAKKTEDQKPNNAGEESKADEAKSDNLNVVTNQPKEEPTKKEIKASIVEKIAEQKAILERHIKLGDELARKIKHRDNLKNIITTLDEFELSLKDNADETDGNYYQGCLLTIKDDNGKTFTTKNPTIIRGVAEQVNGLCTDKLEEVETDIVNLIPNA